MSEEKKDISTAETVQEEKTFTQEQLNKLVGDARTKERKKLNDVKSELESLQKKLDELTNYKKESEPKLEQLKILEKSEAKRKCIKKVAEETGVSSSIIETLAGDTEDELMENAKKVLKTIGAPKEFYNNAHVDKKEKNTFSEKLENYLKGD